MAGPFGRERFDEARLINIANGLTAVRVLLVPLFAYLLISHRFRLALAVFAVCGTSDGLDGLVARRLRQRTVVGFFLDPIADKLLMATAFVVLTIVEIVPTWLTVMVISRDVFILTGSLLILLLFGSGDIEVTGLSKVNTGVQIVTVCFFLTVKAFPGIWSYFPGDAEGHATGAIVALCAFFTGVTGLQYLAVGIRKLSQQGRHSNNGGHS